MNDRAPRYLRALRGHLKDNPPDPGELHHVEVRHDPDCPHWDGGSCDCDAEVESGERVDRKYGVDDPEEGES